MICYETRIGSVTISNDYFAKLIGKAVSSCYGVVGMVPHGKQRLFEIITTGIHSDRGIKVKGDINSINVDLHIVVSYGIKIVTLVTAPILVVDAALTGKPEDCCQGKKSHTMKIYRYCHPLRLTTP